MTDHPQKGGALYGCEKCRREEGQKVFRVEGAVNRALYRGVAHEVDVTLQVAVMLAMDSTAAAIQSELGIDKVEYEMCVRRLARVIPPSSLTD